MVTDFAGLQWKKVDLHVHTPGSRDDYEDLSVSANSVIQHVLQAGLDAVAVTDHNTGAWVDELKTAAKGTRVTVFPGVEVTVMGGERNVHLLAIFDPSKGTSHVHDFLAQVEITEEKRGRTDTLAEGDVNQVIDKIARNEGIALLAHSDSTSGVLAEMRGQARIAVIQNPRLLGAEITKDETAGYLDGDDPNYRRQLACFKGSDSHGPGEVGRRASYFKLGAMSVAGLRQCLYDPDTRVRITDYALVTYPTIRTIELSGGFFDGVCAIFHEGLNTVLGGKGVGKSLLIEFLRFALDQPSDVPAIRQDMDGKLEKQLGLGGRVTVVCELSSGRVYEVTRQFDGVTNPIATIDSADQTEYAGSIAKLFPLLAYSQNEVIDISRDTSVQRLLIDRLIDVDSHYRVIDSVKGRLRANTDGYIEALFATEKTADLSAQIATYESQIEELDRILGDPKFREKKIWDRRANFMADVEEEAERLIEDVKEIAKEGLSARLPHLGEEDKEEPDIKKFHSTVLDSAQKLERELNQGIESYGAALESARPVRARWNERRAKWEMEFDEFLQAAGGRQEALSKQRSKLQGEQTARESERAELTTLAEQLGECSKERENLLDELEGAKRDLYDTRTTVYAELTAKSDGRLQLELLADEDRVDLVEGIGNLFHGMRIQQRFVETLATNLTPREFVSVILRRDVTTVEGLGLTPETSSKIVDSIPGNENLLRQLLALPYECMPGDVPRILYKKEDGNYYPLSELSVGQKCTALILIALSEGEMPIIIDQPEDALDVATIYLDVVLPLRRGKDQRQFIITTHNANVAVSSDSDKFHVLKGTATAGEIVCAGAIDMEHVAREVIEHLEGGVGPYVLRGLKYNIEQK